MRTSKEILLKVIVQRLSHAPCMMAFLRLFNLFIMKREWNFLDQVSLDYENSERLRKETTNILIVAETFEVIPVSNSIVGEISSMETFKFNKKTYKIDEFLHHEDLGVFYYFLTLKK